MPCSKHEDKSTPSPASAMTSALTPASRDLPDPLDRELPAMHGDTIDVQPSNDVAELDWSTAQRKSVVGQLLNEHFDRVYRYAYYLSGQASVAEDIAQEVFLRAFRSIHQLRDQEASVGWLLTIARNEFGRYCQSQKPSMHIDSFAPAEDCNHVNQIDCQDWVHHALEQLPVEFRTVVLMFYFEEKSYIQIATELQLPIGTVMSRLSRGRNHLKQALETQSDARPVESRAGVLAKDHQR